ncbi:MAG: hypothetical protein ABH864_06775 [archaeon]
MDDRLDNGVEGPDVVSYGVPEQSSERVVDEGRVLSPAFDQKGSQGGRSLVDNDGTPRVYCGGVLVDSGALRGGA